MELLTVVIDVQLQAKNIYKQCDNKAKLKKKGYKKRKTARVKTNPYYMQLNLQNSFRHMFLQ